jgi:hypothetical protein
MMELTPRELAIVLAALRCYQQVYDSCDGDLTDDVQEIATNSGEFEAMNLAEIDDLCERLNV